MSRRSQCSAMVSFLFVMCVGLASALVAAPRGEKANKTAPRLSAHSGFVNPQGRKPKRSAGTRSTTTTPTAATADSNPDAAQPPNPAPNAGTQEVAANTTTNDPPKANLNGTYKGTVHYPAGGMLSEATLQIEGDQFTLTSGANTLSGTLMVRGKKTAAMTITQPSRAVISLNVTHSGEQLTLKSVEGEARAFMFNTGTRAADRRRIVENVKPINHSSSVTTIAFSPDGSRMASGSYGEIFLWNTARAGVINSLPGNAASWVKNVAFSPDKSTLAVATDDGAVMLYDASTGTTIGPLPGGTGKELYMLAFSPDGKKLAGGSEDGKVLVWDMGKKELLQTVDGDGSAVRSVAFSPDGMTLATGSRSGAIILWDADKLTQKKKWSGSTEQINALAFSRDGKLLASGGRDKNVQLWDVSKNESAPRTLTRHEQSISSLSFSPDGRTLASASLDKKVILWDVAKAEFKEEWETESEVLSVAFSPNKKVLATGGKDGTLTLWDMK